ncbi:hypothetical protein PV04_00409 [Phialophora macrospora]|uniref:Uncharacterized protein n=1 Tax=Phialophora macrospora TaxID=1851006 RepID=A0A0D2ED29_9EURO|nr:hypothetical protein PV04_00409 [Phialophora macrospora]
MFGSSLVLLAAIIVRHRHGARIRTLQRQNRLHVFQNGLDALEYLGKMSKVSQEPPAWYHGSKSVTPTREMCCFAADVSDVSNQNQTGCTLQQAILLENRGVFDNFSLRLSELSGLSPISLDLGRFAATRGLGNLYLKDVN